MGLVRGHTMHQLRGTFPPALVRQRTVARTQATEGRKGVGGVRPMAPTPAPRPIKKFSLAPSAQVSLGQKISSAPSPPLTTQGLRGGGPPTAPHPPPLGPPPPFLAKLWPW